MLLEGEATQTLKRGITSSLRAGYVHDGIPGAYIKGHLFFDITVFCVGLGAF